MMKTIRTLSLTFLIILFMNYSGFANNQIKNSKEADIKKLVELIDPAHQEVDWLKELFVGVTKVDKSEHERLLREIDFDMVVALYQPFYDKYFSHEEIKELIQFYLTEYGTKMARTKADVFGKQSFTPEEINKIEEFKKTRIGKKYAKLSDKIVHLQAKSVKKFLNSLK